MARKKKEAQEAPVNKEQELLNKIKDLAPKEVKVEEVASTYVTPAEYKVLKPGDWISLNIRKSACFGLEQDGRPIIWLSRKNRSMQIPEGLSDKTMNNIYLGILNEDIVKGNVYISKEDKDPNIINEYMKLLNSPGLDIPEQIKKALKDTARKQKINGITSVEILTKLFEYENKNRKRPKVLEFLEDLASFSSKFHNISYEVEEIEPATKIVLNGEDLSKIQSSSKKEVIEKAGINIKRKAPTSTDFSNLYKSI